MTDCLMFFQCEMMTGQPYEQCPNRDSCKQSSQNLNRYCKIPYQICLPSKDQLFSVPTLKVLKHLEDKSIEVGWYPAVDTFYSYKDGCLKIGKDEYGYNLPIPEEAAALGFAEAEEIPYKYRQLREYGKLEVTYDSRRFRELGWHAAIFLPYWFHHDTDTGKLFLKVEFDHTKLEYQEAIALGWYSSCKWYPRPQKTPSNVLTENSPHLDSEQNDPDDIPF